MATVTIKSTFTAFVMLLITLFLPGCSGGEEENNKLHTKSTPPEKLSLSDQKIFDIESGIIEYEISGSQTGSKKLYFDDWGRRQAEYTNSTIKVGKYTKHTELLKITLGEWQYIINLENKTGTKRENPVVEKMFELKDQINYGKFGEQLLFLNGGFESGNESLAGKNCKIYEFKKQNSKKWMWNWILLKSETQTGGVQITVLAKKIQENVSIPDSIFNLPPNVLITEVDLESIRNQIPEN
jgi:hypothetical protein